MCLREAILGKKEDTTPDTSQLHLWYEWIGAPDTRQCTPDTSRLLLQKYFAGSALFMARSAANIYTAPLKLLSFRMSTNIVSFLFFFFYHKL